MNNPNLHDNPSFRVKCRYLSMFKGVRGLHIRHIFHFLILRLIWRFSTTMWCQIHSDFIVEEHHVTSFFYNVCQVILSWGHPHLRIWAAIRFCLLLLCIFAIGPTEPVFVYWWSVNGLYESVTFLQCRQQNPRLPGSHKLSWTQSRPKRAEQHSQCNTANLLLQ